MKINLISDLHLECADLELPGGDFLIIAGDACEAKHVKQEAYQAQSMMQVPGDPKRNDRYARFFHEECTKYRQVLYVMGNHEHYGYKFNKTYGYLNSQLPDNVRLMEKETHQEGDVLFIGATMWTDLNKGDPLTLMHVKGCMSDYHQITFWDGGATYRRLKPYDTAMDHKTAKQYLQHVVAQNKDKKIVVVTHHAPSALSIDPMYRNDFLMNGAYYSDFSEFLLDNEHVVAWVHGHTHVTHDYLMGKCRVLCNPRGYVPYENTGFDPNFTFEV